MATDMKYKRIYIFFIFLLTIIIIYNYLNPNSFVNHMKSDYFSKKISGKIYDMTPVKGGSLSLSIRTDSKDDGINIRNSDVVLKNIKKGIYFKKIPNSNQCYIINKDSIMYFDCYVFSKEDSIKIGKIKKWERSITNQWILKK